MESKSCAAAVCHQGNVLCSGFYLKGLFVHLAFRSGFRTTDLTVKARFNHGHGCICELIIGKPAENSCFDGIMTRC